MKYQNHSLMIYTDGSVLETGHTGFGFTILDFNLTRSYYKGHSFSIFTAELLVILMSLID